jgi:hypothetical protein
MKEIFAYENSEKLMLLKFSVLYKILILVIIIIIIIIIILVNFYKVFASFIVIFLLEH